MTAEELIAFEQDIFREFEAGHIRGPIHLSGGNEQQLIDIFKRIKRTDWVFSTWRNHYHALLHGVPKGKLRDEILAGRNMNFSSKEHNFFTSAIVGGTLSIACGVAYALRDTGHHVWCFVGDMAASTGAFWEADSFSFLNDLPITFVVEDNRFSADSPTDECWGDNPSERKVITYAYERTLPHAGIGKWVSFK